MTKQEIISQILYKKICNIFSRTFAPIAAPCIVHMIYVKAGEVLHISN